ncbi:MAG: class I SAM-dependent methyltransferase [Erysipelotrichaceae bacterium]
MKKIANWQDYQCLLTGNGRKIEKWGKYLLDRPDPQAIWPLPKHDLKIDAFYQRSKAGGGNWEYQNKLPETWILNYQELTFKVAPLGFKHTGIFPEQASNWDYITQTINNAKIPEIRVLNLFAYTGGATLAAARSKAHETVHVDSSKGMVNWAKDNLKLSNLEHKTVRFIVEDCLKFIAREQRRGRTYHAIIMDPPSYGRGPNNEIWKFEEQINNLIKQATKLLDKDALFMLVNVYTTGLTATVIENILKTIVQNKLAGKVSSGELTLPISQQDMLLPCGNYGLWEND